MANTNGHGPKKRAILYARVSTEEQMRCEESLVRQLEGLAKHAARKGYEVFEEVVDPGQSGVNLSRPGLDLVRDLVGTGGVDAVLACDLSRFSREPTDLRRLKREFERHGTSLLAAEGGAR